MATHLRKQARFDAGAIFSIVAMLAIAFFELVTQVSSGAGSLVLVPYISFIALSGIVAMLMSHWYLPETGLFEAVAEPAVVLVVAVALSGISFTAASTMLSDSNSIGWEMFGYGLYVGVFFLSVSWPVLVPGLAVASVVMRARHSQSSQQGAV